MTREYITLKLAKYADGAMIPIGYADNIVGEVFDYFEPKLKEANARVESFCNLNNAVNEAFKEIQSRNCGNCKWFVPHRADIPNEFEGTCDAGVCMDYDNLGYMVAIDFMCSEWEKKQ